MIYKKYILVVDDNEVNRKILYRILSDTYNILQASNGKEALDVIEKYGENISLILLDLLMPVMDGYHFIERQQQIPLLKSIPVMITTQKDSDKDEIEALSKGAADFLTKPYNAALIKHRVANIIKLRETAAFVNVVEHDGLTGLYNKEAFYERVSQKLAHRDIKDEYDIICMDIENFKLVNDMFGEKEGDKLLCYVANAIKTTINPVNGIAARITGDIFVILLPRIFGHEQEFVSAIQKQLPEYTSKFNVIIRFGVYQIIDEDIPVRAMCDRAKLASHTIKGIYDQYYIYYDDKLRNTLLDEQEITGLMQEALNQGQFTVYFQPKCCLESEKIIGAEALVRWHHPQKGFLSPADFIPLFEKNGFITTLDLYVLEKTCQELRKWIDAGYNVVPISVNISRVDIYNPQLPEIISDIVNKYNLDTKYLHIEITESAYTENAKQLIDMVTSMKARGFVVEMDDFGSGYSSLNMLSDVPVDTLKLDMRFLRGNNSKNKSEDILDFIVNLAERLKLSVIAEGIETQIDLNFLRSIGCEFGQGYYFSKPLPSEDFEKLIKNIDKTDIHISKKDISHNMKYEEYLHYYELRSLINHIPGGIFKCKADVCGKIEFASDNLFDIIGYTRQEFEELFDNVFENLIYEEDRENSQGDRTTNCIQ
ncbi:MAG: EAL domain-containing protein [Oscillospiraceae bacterium]